MHSGTPDNEAGEFTSNRVSTANTAEQPSTAEQNKLFGRKPEHDALIGKIIAGRYQIIELIGSGGFGSVYKAKHLSLNKIIALKILRAEYVEDKKIAARFQHEAMIASNILNPHIAAAFDHGICEETKVVFIAMEYVPGPSLKDLLKSNQKLEVERCLNILIQLCDGIGAAHSKSVLHRDIKPSNIILTNYDHNPDFVKITDFGIAKVLSESEELKKLTKTETDSFLGTCQYMGPEQFEAGYKGDYRSDIYSLGCVLFELLAGKPPFDGGSHIITAHMHATARIPDLTTDSIEPIIKSRLTNILSKTLAKDPSARYQTLNDLRTDLESVQLRLNQLKAGKTNVVMVSLETLWLFLSQAIRRAHEKLFSIRLSSSGITVGSVMIIALLVLIMIGATGAVFLFSSSPASSIANRELPLKPIIDKSVKVTDPKLAESLWTELESPSVHEAPLSEHALNIFIQVADSNKKVGNYEVARWWYYRAGLVIGWLKLNNSILAARVNNSYAESCLLVNMAIYSTNQIQNEQLKLLVKKFGKLISPQILREKGLAYAANAATARDAALGTLSVMKNLGNKENTEQELLALGFLAKSFQELGETKEALGDYDKFRTILLANNFPGIDKLQLAFLLAAAGRFYIEQGDTAKAQDLLMLCPSCLAQLGNLSQYSLAVINNDLALTKEINGEAKEAELLFSESYSFEDV